MAVRAAWGDGLRHPPMHEVRQPALALLSGFALACEALLACASVECLWAASEPA